MFDLDLLDVVYLSKTSQTVTKLDFITSFRRDLGHSALLSYLLTNQVMDASPRTSAFDIVLLIMESWGNFEEDIFL